MASRLANKVVLITGASAGIGASCARAFAAEGSHLILTARRLEKLNSLKEEIKKEHPQVEVLIRQLDVRDRPACQALLSTLPDEERWKGIDVLVNNAGMVLGIDQISDVSHEAVDQMIDTNVKGVLNCTQAFLPLLKSRVQGANIINIGSISGKDVYPGGGVYCATKFAVDALTRTLRYELASSSVRVTAVNPGMVETDFSIVRFYGDKEKAANVYKGIKPLVGDDIAEVVVFVASRPKHVEISDITVFPKGQVSTVTTYKT
ncbi:hypothetical protein L0F63_004119 [Massospora cicadina]|nr:hypothetical protein L0F63_004119 [Massospora cicadina]